MISLSQSLNLEWPIYLKEFINSFSYISFANEMISLDCIFGDFDIKSESLFIKSFLLNLAPFIFCLLSIIYFILSTKNIVFRKIKIVVTGFVVFTFFQPAIIAQIFDMLRCQTLENKQYLKKNLNYECFTEEHQTWVKIFILYIIFLLFF